MIRRQTRAALLLIALLAALAPAPAAFAQGTSPFTPLPPATPQQTATTTQGSSNQDDGGIDTWQAVLIVVGGVILLAGIGIAIARDARRRAPVIDAPDSADHREADSHRRARQTKQRQRERAKAARAARRRNR